MNTEVENIEIIYCRGGSVRAPHVAKMAGMSYGTHYKYKTYAPVTFVDSGLDPVIWTEYYRIVRDLMPKMALVPDYYFPHQLPRVLAQADSLRSLGVLPLICPKFHGAMSNIPRWCRVAISVPAEDYAGFLPDDDEVIDRDLHLLGGSPAQYLYIIRHRYQQSRVLSVDGNKFARKAGSGQVWIANQARWKQVEPAHRVSNYILERVSAVEIVRYLHNPHSGIHYNHPSVQKCRPRAPKQINLMKGI